MSALCAALAACALGPEPEVTTERITSVSGRRACLQRVTADTGSIDEPAGLVATEGEAIDSELRGEPSEWYADRVGHCIELVDDPSTRWVEVRGKVPCPTPAPS